MDRNATILYLKNVLDLEVAKREVVQKYNQEKSTYQSQTSNLQKERKSIPAHQCTQIDIPLEPKKGRLPQQSTRN